ncbi:MAG TPA: RNA ligase (ATP) [Saccharofermentans sp.]|nr:RNA ligase (ATP) [Saccharofermentans sp.]
MERNLVTIEVVQEIKPIEGADNIEMARVRGAWWCVVKKNEFKVGDVGVYFEIDSMLPLADPRFAFLRRPDDKPDKTHHRLRTRKCLGQISQGLLLPYAIFAEQLNIDDEWNFEEIAKAGTCDVIDVARVLGIEKFEPPIPACLAGEVLGTFPNFIPKTDQERVQNLNWENIKDHKYEVTVKMDGSSMTAYLKDGHFGVCSRNLELKETEKNTFWKLAREYGLEERLRRVGRNVAIQGEAVGEGINGNRAKMKGQHLYIFDVFDIDNNRKMLPIERMEFLSLLTFGFDFRPITSVPISDIVVDCNSIQDIVDFASTHPSPHANSDLIEGLVFKAMDCNFSFKAISNRYLLKHNE